MGKDLLLIAVLKGSVLFLADLMRAISIPHEIDFLATGSYGASTMSTGVVRILKDLNEPIEGRHVLLVEDIIDSGHTLAYLTQMFNARNPASLEIVTLLDKPTRREVDIDVYWTGLITSRSATLRRLGSREIRPHRWRSVSTVVLLPTPVTPTRIRRGRSSIATQPAGARPTPRPSANSSNSVSIRIIIRRLQSHWQLSPPVPASKRFVAVCNVL